MSEPEPVPVVRCQFSEMAPLADVLGRRNPRNPNEHPPAQVALLLKIILATGWRAPIVISRLSGLVTRGHGRLSAAELGKLAFVPIQWQDYDSPEQELEDLLADNLVAEMATMNQRGLEAVLAELKASNRDSELAGIVKAAQTQQEKRKAASATLGSRFIVPPYNALDSSRKDWRARVELWGALGLADPAEAVRTEIAAHWFLPSTGSGVVLDPFATVARAAVVAFFGHSYNGITRDAAEAEALTHAVGDLFAAVDMKPQHAPKFSPEFDDMPPRADLVVSSVPGRGQTPASSHEAALRKTVKRAAAKLYANRFSVWFVDHDRDEHGFAHDMAVAVTDAQAPKSKLWETAVILHPIETLAMQAARAFPASRRLAKTSSGLVITFNGQRLALEAAADRAVAASLVISYNGENSAKIKDALGTIPGRALIPLGDIIKALTTK